MRKAASARFRVLGLLLSLISQTLHAQMQSLSATKLQENEILEIRGEWDFFWGEWIEAGDERPAPQKAASARSWSHDLDPGLKTGQGYASYRLVLTDLEPRMDGYSLAIRSASVAMKFMMYPRHKPEKIRVVTAGRVGTSMNEEIPQLRATHIRFFPEPDEKEWVVLLHVSNFHYSRGGLWTGPLLSHGNFAEFRLTEDRELLLFCLGMITVIGVYNIVLFIRRPSDKPTLMLALFCAVVCLRSCVADNLIAWYIPALDARLYHMKYLLEYATMVLGPLACISFLHFSFAACSLPRFYRFVVNLSLLAGLVILTLDTYTRSLLLVPIQLVIVVQITFGLTVVTRAVIQRRHEALLAASGCFILSGCVFYDILVTFNIFSQPYLTSIGMSFFVFMQSQVVAQRFAKAFRVAEHLSERLKDEVDRQTLELRSIMENIPQGVFIMLADRTIQRHYSRELEMLLGEQNLAGRLALPMLFQNSKLTDEDRSIIDSILVSIFHEPLFVWELNLPNLPQEFKRFEGDAQQTFTMEWHPIVNRDGLVDRVLVTLRNVTEIRGLQASLRKDQEAFACLLEIVQIAPDRFRDFMQQSQDMLRRAQFDTHESDFLLMQRKVLMRLHTWKGLARSLHMKSLTSSIHDAEKILSGISAHDRSLVTAELDALTNKLSAYEKVGTERLGHMSSLAPSQVMSAEMKDLLGAWYRYHYEAGAAQRQALDQAMERYVKSLPDITTGQLLDTLQSEMDSLARDLDKPIAVLERQGLMEEPLPPLLFRSLGYALQHLLRNSLDHGLESAAERKAKGKAAEGRITIAFAIRNGILEMDYRDDGRGLDLQKVRRKAEELGLVSPRTPLRPEDIAPFIFVPGFSTKGEASMISGRGIGMDAVRLLVEESGGTIALIPDQADQSVQAFHLRASWPIEMLISEAS
ncbi:MAG TPA: 7TM diverse intracellular signaling domain-containing protein [Oligoflexus sp.]|uniref:7TM diverse intracellular signaling domain-containing protein n=1 Tax=Oligoflexus sp. TaxID=1971216 RepID=UPI002D806462|nr:7TM diverse intracellular signaling domain-containing protein [Oligoflexus sp.]HET9238320.1 7TM diverse intracellular signaling domain-containing protein [Oligoflexus sp.]